MRNAVLKFTLALTCLLGAVPVQAQTQYPDRTIKIVVPFPPGGGVDLIARRIGQGLQEDLGQAVIIENKPGGGTTLGTDFVAKSPPDGYTLVLASFAHAVNPSLMPSLPFDTRKSFSAIGMIGRSYNVLVVSPKSQLKSVADILRVSREKSGSLTYASQGVGTSAHLAGELFKNLAGVDIVHVPYRGVAQALQDVLSGQVDMMWPTSAAATALINAGKFHAVASTAPAGKSPMPGVTTIAESGLPTYVVDGWYGVYAPANLPKDIVAKLNGALNRVVQTPAFQKGVEPEGLVVTPGTPEDFDQFVRGEEIRWRKIVTENKITIN
jgi:tripartite-type tricarboxylate transporter receptor subunit TctC